MTSLDDTIAAPASAAGPGLRAIVRVSGGGVRQVVEACFQPDDEALWRTSRRAVLHPGRFCPAGFSAAISGTVSLWPTARSYTGEPLAELHLTGSPPVVEAVLETLFDAGARPAQAGEFTLRAFLSGRIDLVQAEAVLGVIDADEPRQLSQALSQLAGGISSQMAVFREQLLLHLADLEAGLDFVEEDIDFVSRETLRRHLREALGFVERLSQQADVRMQTTGRRKVVLAGLPNAGKSTLFNVLTGSDSAIVSPVRGTTRDVLVRPVEWDGLAIDLYDTAGCELTDDPVMAQAEALRTERLQSADLVVWCHRSHDPAAPAPEWLSVVTKSDLDVDPDAAVTKGELRISVRTGTGLETLRRAIVERLRDGTSTDGELIASTASRCRSSLARAAEALTRALSAADAGAGDELVAIELRLSLDELGQICGAVYTDDILDRIFSRFCIGK